MLAPNNATSTLTDLANQVRQDKADLFADNGNFVEIGKIRSKFGAEARKLHRQVDTFKESTLGRSVRPGELTAALQSQYLSLAKRVRAESATALLDDDKMLAAQQILDATHLIGTEDITMAAWLGLDVERAYTNMPRATYRAMNRKVARRAVSVTSTLPGPLCHHYFPVASAVSYNTAVDAGKEFAKAGVRSISLGFGSFMADSNFCDYMLFGRKRLDFGANLPMRYVRTVAVVLGFWRGYTETLGKPPIRFHFLGLGAPIMLPLVAFGACRSSELSFDATSPIKDATIGGTLYVDKPAPLKIRIRSAAFRLASTPGAKWDCPCPFCQHFSKKHPFKYRLGRQWFLRKNPKTLKAADLRPTGDLFRAYPLFAEPAAGSELRKLVNFCRVGHNHWITERVVLSINNARTKKDLEARAQNIVDDYCQNTSAPFASAIMLSWQLLRDT